VKEAKEHGEQKSGQHDSSNHRREEKADGMHVGTIRRQRSESGFRAVLSSGERGEGRRYELLGAMVVTVL
jgi:hypothetical protein